MRDDPAPGQWFAAATERILAGCRALQQPFQIKVGDQVYPVSTYLIATEKFEEICQLVDAASGRPFLEGIRLMQRQLQLWVPTLPDEVALRLTGRQVLNALHVIWERL